MSATEVLYVARGVERNAPRAERLEHHCKGAILAVRPKGAWISPDAFDAWLRGGDEPEGLRTIEEHKADELRLWVRQARYYTGASFDPLRELARLKKPTTGAAVRGMQGKVQTYRNSIEKIERLGLDSNWGFADLATFGVMITEPIPLELVNVIQAPAIDLAGDPDEDDVPLAKSSRFNVFYERILSAKSVKDTEEVGRYRRVRRDADPVPPGIALDRLE